MDMKDVVMEVKTLDIKLTIQDGNTYLVMVLKTKTDLLVVLDTSLLVPNT